MEDQEDAGGEPFLARKRAKREAREPGGSGWAERSPARAPCSARRPSEASRRARDPAATPEGQAPANSRT